MRFTPQQSRAILDRRQTMVHIIAREPRTIQRTRKVGPRAEVGGKPRSVPYGPERTSRPFVPRVGLEIAFTHDEQRAVIVVTECTDEPVALSSFSVADAKAVGHASADAYRTWWVRRYDHDWLTRAEARERGAHRQAFIPRMILQRFEDRHADTPVWPLRFRLASEVEAPPSPVFLLPGSRARAGVATDYTTDPGAAVDAGEVLDAAQLNPTWAADAEKRRKAERAEEEARRAMRSTFARARQVCLDGLANGRDIQPVLATIDKALAELEDAA